MVDISVEKNVAIGCANCIDALRANGRLPDIGTSLRQGRGRGHVVGETWCAVGWADGNNHVFCVGTSFGNSRYRISDVDGGRCAICKCFYNSTRTASC